MGRISLIQPDGSEQLVHRLENVDGNPTKFRVACGRYHWTGPASLLDPNRVSMFEVTCPECIIVMLNSKPVKMLHGANLSGVWMDEVT
jgi:hypothetical protein